MSWRGSRRVTRSSSTLILRRSSSGPREKVTSCFCLTDLTSYTGTDPLSWRSSPSRWAGKCPIVLTSRPSAVLAIEIDPKVTLLRLQPFSPQDQRRYFGEHYTQAKAACSFALDLTQVPMLAYMVRKLLRAGGIKQGATRTELYQAFVHHILATHEPNRPIDLDDPDRSRRVQTALKCLAFQALAQPKPDIQKVPTTRYPEDARVPLKELTHLWAGKSDLRSRRAGAVLHPPIVPGVSRGGSTRRTNPRRSSEFCPSAGIRSGQR